MQNLITLNDIEQLAAHDFEEYRAAGHELRRDLTHAVIRELQIPEGWHINGEYGCEFGGFFPVQCRLTPAHEKFSLTLCSPGEVSPVWMMVFIDASGQPFSVVRTMLAFNPELVSHTLSLVACLDADGYSVASIISTLAQEGGL